MSAAVESMMKNTEVLFITGAGISVDSGVPTFRGKDGMYSKKFVFEGEEI